jgi:hypothetical protein
MSGEVVELENVMMLSKNKAMSLAKDKNLPGIPKNPPWGAYCYFDKNLLRLKGVDDSMKRLTTIMQLIARIYPEPLLYNVLLGCGIAVHILQGPRLETELSRAVIPTFVLWGDTASGKSTITNFILESTGTPSKAGTLGGE